MNYDEVDDTEKHLILKEKRTSDPWNLSYGNILLN